MRCGFCGTENPEAASFCAQCGRPLGPDQPAKPDAPAAVALAGAPAVPTKEDLAGFGRRVAAQIVDEVLAVIPLIGLIAGIINLFMCRRGTSIGMKVFKVRIVRQNGDVSGAYHTYCRLAAAWLSLLPLGLGYWWALWDPMKQTWHDKLMRTYVLRDSGELSARKATSSTAAVVATYLLVALLLLAIYVGVLLVASAIGGGFDRL